VCICRFHAILCKYIIMFGCQIICALCAAAAEHHKPIYKSVIIEENKHSWRFLRCSMRMVVMRPLNSKSGSPPRKVQVGGEWNCKYWNNFVSLGSFILNVLIVKVFWRLPINRRAQSPKYITIFHEHSPLLCVAKSMFSCAWFNTLPHTTLNNG